MRSFCCNLKLPVLFCAAMSSALASSWYVDPEAVGTTTGQDWQNAWTNFAQIAWPALLPGDTIYLSGGDQSKVYRETLHVGADGAPGNHITIRPGQDPGHLGVVIIDAEEQRPYGVVLRSYVTLSGDVNGSRNLQVVNAAQTGIRAAHPRNVTISFVEVTGSLLDGIEFTFPDQNSLIIDSFIGNNARNGYRNQGSEASDERTRIYRCVVWNHGADGITVDSGHEISACLIGDSYSGGSSDGIEANGYNNRMFNNIVVNVAGTAIINKVNQKYSAADRIIIANNLIIQTSEYASRTMRGIIVSAGSLTPVSDVLVANNTIVDLDYFGLSITLGEATRVEVINNVLFNVTRSRRVNYGHRFSFDAGTILVDYNTISPGPSGLSNFRWQNQQMTYAEFVSQGLGQTNGSELPPSFLSYRELENVKGDLYIVPPYVHGANLEAWADSMSLPALLRDMDGFQRDRWDHSPAGVFSSVGDKLEICWNETGERVRLRAPLEASETYDIGVSDDLDSWRTVLEGVAGQAMVLNYEEAFAHSFPQRMYRLMRESPE